VDLIPFALPCPALPCPALPCPGAARPRCRSRFGSRAFAPVRCAALVVVSSRTAPPRWPARRQPEC